MMLKTMKRWVDSLFLGTWHLPDGRVFECTPADRDYYYSRSKEFFQRGIPMPVALEHQPDVGLNADGSSRVELSHHDKLADQTRKTLGHCHDVQIGKDGQLQFLVDGTEDDLTVMAKNKFVSPEIRCNVMDTRTGERFIGPSIVHLASTPRPVQVTGKPHFQLSQSKPISLSQTAVAVSLSMAIHQDVSLAARKTPPKHKGKGPGGGRFVGNEGGSSGNDADHKMKAHEVAEATAVAKHGTTTGPAAEDTYKRVYMNQLNKLRASGSKDADHDEVAAKVEEAKKDPTVASQVAETAKKLNKPEEPLWKWAAKTALKYGLTAGAVAMYACVAAVNPNGINNPDSMTKLLDAIWGDNESESNVELSMAKPPTTPDEDDAEGQGDATQDLPGADMADADQPPPPSPVVDPAAMDANNDGKITSDEARGAAVMKELEGDIASLGPTIHSSAHEDPITFMEHLSTAIKTYKKTRAGGEGEPKPDDQDQPQADPNNPNSEPEVAEPQPIMMSNTTFEAVLTKKVLKDSLSGLTPRIDTLHKQGWIDDANKKDLLTRLGTISLSVSDIDAKTGDVRPNVVEIEVAAIERLARSGKPGPFAKSAKPAPAPNPHKPISAPANVSLSAGEELVRAPYQDDDGDTPEAARKRGEAAGDELARLAGCSTK